MDESLSLLEEHFPPSFSSPPPRSQPIRSPLPAGASPSPSFNIVWHTGIRFILRHSISYCSSSSREEALSESSIGSQATELEWPANRVRDTFIKFFEDKGHVHWTSSPVVSHNDPTLLFANADSMAIPKHISDTFHGISQDGLKALVLFRGRVEVTLTSSLHYQKILGD
ncbi:Alanine--tRNA ligase [Forsythia ovata]|uniref:Alanine--tRNA ligase n=1 Tax=Forsythia ovata TaxID=205694 RepID=A0ABD1WZX8_9LAMI